MSIDIYLDTNGVLQRSDTDVYKARNILSVQKTNTHYRPDLGIDLKRFIDPKVKIQFETFRSYTLQEMVQQGARIDAILEVQQDLDKKMDYNVSKTTTEGMIE
jgi:hypothetical protein